MTEWHPGGFDHSQAHAQYHHMKHEIEQDHRDRNMHHNIASEQTKGEQKRSWFVVRVWRRLFG